MEKKKYEKPLTKVCGLSRRPYLLANTSGLNKISPFEDGGDPFAES